MILLNIQATSCDFVRKSSETDQTYVPHGGFNIHHMIHIYVYIYIYIYTASAKQLASVYHMLHFMSEVHTASARQPANVYTIHIYLRVFTHTHTASAKQPASVYMILASIYERQDVREQQKRRALAQTAGRNKEKQAASACSNRWPTRNEKAASARSNRWPKKHTTKKAASACSNRRPK